MFPVDVLVSEHVLIIRVINLIRKETEHIAKTQTVKSNAITQFIGFLRVYADKYHHGKEEGILFRELSQKKLNETDQKFMFELMMEHALARKTISGLEKAKDSYVEGKTEVLPRYTSAA